jgi:hypothetical protein
MDQNTLLTLMLASYLAPIGFVYYKYTAAASGTRSISSIITSCEPLYSCENNTGGGGTQQQQRPPLFQERHFLAACMFIMAVFTILYEIQRNLWSLAIIIALLIGIFGVIYIPETSPVHYIFAGTVFVAMIGFMIGHTLYADYGVHGVHDNLRILLYAQILFMVVTVIGVLDETPIFVVEALFILNFAVFYLYLHSIPFHSIPFHSIPFHYRFSS